MNIEDKEAYTMAQVIAALNHAADDIIEAADLPETGTRDALNLMVSAVPAYLTGDAEDLASVVEDGYGGETLDTVIGWIVD